MVICAKQIGSPRRTIDFQPLNIYATRETHHTQSPFHQARSVSQGKKKTVFDAWNGSHSVPPHPDNWHYTMFTTPWGRYRYCTAPQDYFASGDGYTRRYNEITTSILNKTKCVDDTLLRSDTIEESFFKWSIGWTPAADKGLPSTRTNFALPMTWSNLQALKSPTKLYDHARGTSRASLTFQHHRA